VPGLNPATDNPQAGENPRVDWTLATLAGTVLAYGAVSRRLGLSVVTAAIFFVSAGLVLGKKGLGWIDLPVNGHQVRVLAEVTLTLVLFADASRIDLRAARKEYRVPARLLGIGLPLTILAGLVAGVAVFGGLGWAEVLVLAVIVAPTDAALGQSVVTDPRLPSRIRQGLNVESGLNDGICVPLLFIALAIAGTDEGKLSAAHAARLVVEEIGWGLVGGVVAGVAGALVLRLAVPRKLIEGAWLQVVPVAAAGLAYGVAAALGGSGFIAAFVAGLVFGGLHEGTEGEVEYLLEELGGLASAVTFLVFGAAIVGPVLANLTWAAAGYAVLSLTAVRMLPVALALLGTSARRPTVAFLGWFGPRGLASIVFVVISVEGSSLQHSNEIVVAVVATIVLSVYAHGLSSRPLTDRYARWFRGHPEDARPRMESVHAPHQRWRRPTASPAAYDPSVDPAKR
jgi:NhaP-type Na+/H+ or K+/H+ antiporter